MSADWLDQDRWRLRCEWGSAGARRAGRRGDIVVVVDTLSFSTATVTAVAAGASIIPLAEGEEGEAKARTCDAELAVRREEVPEKGRFSLSPATFDAELDGVSVVLPSPNGSLCCAAAMGEGDVLVAAFVNIKATTAALRSISRECRPITVVAAGERWPVDDLTDGSLRFAVEDFLAAGALLDALGTDHSPEAATAVASYRALQERLPTIVRDCASGRELIGRGFADDVERALAHNACPIAVILRDRRLVRYDPPLSDDHPESTP